MNREIITESTYEKSDMPIGYRQNQYFCVTSKVQSKSIKSIKNNTLGTYKNKEDIQ